MNLAAQPEIIASATPPEQTAGAESPLDLPSTPAPEGEIPSTSPSGHSLRKPAQGRRESAGTMPVSAFATEQAATPTDAKLTVVAPHRQPGVELGWPGAKSNPSAEMPGELPAALPLSQPLTVPSAGESEAAAPAFRADAQAGLDLVPREIGRLAVELRQLGAETVSVVIRTEPQSALFMRLRLSNGQVHVRAQVKEGNCSALLAHWPELQASLARQNIHLEPLILPETIPSAEAGAFGGATADQRQRDPQTPRKPALAPLRVTELRPEMIGPPSQGRKTWRRAGWEHWA